MNTRWVHLSIIDRTSNKSGVSHLYVYCLCTQKVRYSTTSIIFIPTMVPNTDLTKTQPSWACSDTPVSLSHSIFFLSFKLTLGSNIKVFFHLPLNFPAQKAAFTFWMLQHQSSHIGTLICSPVEGKWFQ